MLDFETIGKYEILETIGEGGFGVVYRARDPLMERLVAIKVCSTEDEHIRKRFLREAKIAGGLDHPNIVTAFDFGTERDLPYLVQELLSGEDLRIKIEREDPIEPAVKLDYLIQIAKGLNHAHDQGVLHRDVKPANVRVLDDGRVKVMDFGMAKIGKDTTTRLTQAGAVMGTAGYFAPEQLKALDLDQRVDIFSFGVLAYELLTYNKAFPGDSFMVVFRQVLHDEPKPIEELWPECPDELARVVATCLQKERDDRYASFSEILPPLFSVLSSAFDRRSVSRGRPEPEDPGVTVLKPRPAIAEIPVEPTIVSGSTGVGRQSPASVDAGHSGSPDSVSSSAAEPEVVSVQQSTGEQSQSLAPGAGTARPDPAATPSKRDAVAKATSAQRRRSLLGPLELRGKGTWIAVGTGIVLVIALAIWSASRSNLDRETTRATSEVSGTGTPDGQELVPTAPTFSVFVDASPWGEIVEVTAESGDTITIPDPPFTPVEIRLPQDSYSIKVKDPSSEMIQSCAVSVSGSDEFSCLIHFASLDPIDYFKEAGWWD